MITVLFLFACGLLGIATDNLLKIDRLNKSGAAFSFNSYIKTEWAAIGISICVLMAFLIGREAIKELYSAGKFLFLAFYGIGLAAQTIATHFKGKAEKAITNDDPAIP
jgi:hypothetical protein